MKLLNSLALQFRALAGAVLLLASVLPALAGVGNVRQQAQQDSAQVSPHRIAQAGESPGSIAGEAGQRLDHLAQAAQVRAADESPTAAPCMHGKTPSHSHQLDASASRNTMLCLG